MTWEMDLRIMQDDAREAGKKEGRKEGMVLGKQEGERKKALEIAEALRKKGMSEAEIEELTDVSEKKETLK